MDPYHLWSIQGPSNNWKHPFFVREPPYDCPGIGVEDDCGGDQVIPRRRARTKKVLRQDLLFP